MWSKRNFLFLILALALALAPHVWSRLYCWWIADCSKCWNWSYHDPKTVIRISPVSLTCLWPVVEQQRLLLHAAELSMAQNMLLRCKLKAMSHEAIVSCNLQRNGVSSCLLQEKSPPVTLQACKIIRLQVIQQLAYVYNSAGACNIFFTQICVASCKKKLPRVTWPLGAVYMSQVSPDNRVDLFD